MDLPAAQAPSRRPYARASGLATGLFLGLQREAARFTSLMGAQNSEGPGGLILAQTADKGLSSNEAPLVVAGLPA